MALGRRKNFRLAESVSPFAYSVRKRRHPRRAIAARLCAHLLELSIGHLHTASLLVTLRGLECDTAGPVAAETVFPEHFPGERAAVVCLKGQAACDYFSWSAQSLVRSATKLNARLRQPF